MHWRKFIYPVIFFIFFYGYTGIAISTPIDVRYNNFLVRYQPDDEKRAMAVVNLLKKNVSKFENFYDISLNNLIVIYLPENKMAFSLFMGSRVPEWSSAVYVPEKRTIVLKKQAWIKGDSFLEQDLLHEISHVYFAEKFRGKKIPLWFNEGLAEYLSGAKIGIAEGVRLSNALFAKKIIPLKDIDSLLQFSTQRAQLAYLEGFSAVKFLQNPDHISQQERQQFFDDIISHDFDFALKKHLGMDHIDFEIKWYRWLQDKYKWFVILNVENVVWVVLIIVLAGAMYAIRYRNRKILSRWEQEETFSETGYQINYIYKEDTKEPEEF